MAYFGPAMQLASRAVGNFSSRISRLCAQPSLPLLNALIRPSIHHTQNLATGGIRAATTTTQRSLASAYTRRVTVGASTCHKFSSRNLTLSSPLQLPQESTVFLMFSRRQWWLFAGGLFVFGAGIVQYMEDKALKKMLSDLDDNTLNSPTLSFMAFRDAALFSRSMARSVFAKNETIIRLACKALTMETSEPEVKAAAVWFLCQVLESEEALPLVVKHLQLADLSAQFVNQVEKYQYTQSISMILETAFNTRPPTKDQEAAQEERVAAMIASLPLQTVKLLGFVSKDTSTHAALLSSPTLVAKTLHLLSLSTKEVPLGSELLQHLSLTHEGRMALLADDAFVQIQQIAFSKNSPTFKVYQEPENQPTFARLCATVSSLYNHNLTELNSKYPTVIADLSDTERLELKTFDLERALTGNELIRFATAVSGAIFIGAIWGGLRGVIRNASRKLNLTSRTALISGASRAMVGAPVALGAFVVAKKAREELKDERLFITASLVGSAASLVAARSLYLCTPFSFVPAALAAWFAFGAARSERAARNQRLLNFKESVQQQQQPSEDAFTKLERTENAETSKTH